MAVLLMLSSSLVQLALVSMLAVACGSTRATEEGTAHALLSGVISGEVEMSLEFVQKAPTCCFPEMPGLIFLFPKWSGSLGNAEIALRVGVDVPRDGVPTDTSVGFEVKRRGLPWLEFNSDLSRAACDIKIEHVDDQRLEGSFLCDDLLGHILENDIPIKPPGPPIELDAVGTFLVLSSGESLLTPRSTP